MTEADFPFVSVIILNYNGLRFAEQCVRSVVDSDYPNLELVVVDNGSTDGSYQVLFQSFSSLPNFKIVRNSRNLGFAEGNNVGYGNSKGDIVIFLNVDTTVDGGWLAPLVTSMISDEQVGGAQCKLLNMKNREAIDSAGSFVDFLGYVYARKSNSADQPFEIFYADGAAMAFKRRVLDEVAFNGKPLDPDYFVYYEDSDLCWRIRLRGYKIVLVPSSVVHHYRGGAGGRSLGYAGTFFFTRNHFLTLMKNYSLRNLVPLLSLLFLLETGQVAVLLAKKPQRALAKARAMLWTFLNLRIVWTKRLLVQGRVRRVPDQQTMRCMLRPNLAIARRLGSFY